MNEGEPKGKDETSDSIKFLKSEGVKAAETVADAIIERASLNEAIKVIEELEKEVSEMTMPARFSRTKKPAESVYAKSNIVHNLKDKTEDEYKRETLLIALRAIKSRITADIARLHGVVMDIEVTKQEA